MTSTRTLVLTAAAVTLLVGLQARLLPYLPGDVAIAHAFQAGVAGHGLGGADGAQRPARRASSS